MSKQAPAFHCPECDSINFQFRDTCLNCGLLFNVDDKKNKPTETDRIMGPLIESKSRNGFPTTKREVHILDSYDSDSGGSVIERVYAESPATEKFTTEDRLRYELANERKKTNKHQILLSWIAFIIIIFLGLYFSK
ncbi:MAG TPA: hypothetical protein ENH23_03835 [candidate division Zixibacteria bacterium]|nr:hypothetical protein [candidate division Zixibacteria bacterium]